MNRIKELRHTKNPVLTQQRLADLVGVARSTVAMWEAGKNEPDNETLLKLAEIFNVSTDYILGASVTDNERNENEHYGSLNDLYYHGVQSWINKGFFSADEKTMLKAHFSGVLSRYKELVEETSNVKRTLELYLKAIEPFNNKRSSPLTTQELAEQFLKQELERVIDGLKHYIDVFTFHFSKTVADENLVGQTPSSREMQESERCEVEEYRRQLFEDQAEIAQQKKPTPVTEDELEEMFIQYAQALNPEQQRMMLDQMQRMIAPRKAKGSPAYQDGDEEEYADLARQQRLLEKEQAAQASSAKESGVS